MPLTMDKPHAPSLSPVDVSDLISNGNIIVDTRHEATFGSSHIPGSYNIQSTVSEFEQRVGWMTPLDAPIILIAENEREAQAAMRALAFLGLDLRVGGWLDGGIPAWADSGYPLASLPQVTVQDLDAHLQTCPDMRVLDVRESYEWDAGHIAGAHHLNYKSLPDQLDQLVFSPEEPISVVCAGGMRSSTACSVLLRNGFGNVCNTAGGMDAWMDANLPVTTA